MFAATLSALMLFSGLSTQVGLPAMQGGLISAHITTTSQIAYLPARGLPVVFLNDSASSLTEAILPVLEPKTYTVKLTAYSSSEDETDSTPFTTASGKHTRDGIVAANFLPFGTRIQIPALFGDKIFIVEDRMHRRKINNVDIWMSSKRKALNFGITEAEIVVVNEPTQIAEQ